MTYPERLAPAERTDEKLQQIRSLLELVGVGYLIDRWAESAHNEEDMAAVLAAVSHGTYCKCSVCLKAAGIGVQWEAVLSLGEQQRIGVTRMFYHNRPYAVLDECTSAVSLDVEAKLYEAAHKRGIACITVSQRLCLEQFHAKELRVGANVPNGWTLRNLQS
eukprot:SAG31_NODE_770_length_12217_cov_2.855174_7_plen_162_part_00